LPATSAPVPQSALGNLPASLRSQLLAALNDIVQNFTAGRWEPSELNAGKLCEIVYTIIRGFADGAMPAKASKPANMVDACRGLEKETALPRSLRIQVPRMLTALYEIRNNRGVGHVGGDVDPNHMDAVAVLAMAKWIVAELVRVFHNVDTAMATAVTDALIEREVPLIWSTGDKKRVLNAKLTLKQKTLLLLYGEAGPVDERDLLAWVEPSRASDYRRDVLRRGHKHKLLEYDEATATVELSPLGARVVEEQLQKWEAALK
jgi:hypothetical protein